MDYYCMKRRELQALCKKHNIPANSANSVLADKLSELLNEKQKPNAQQRTCIKSSVETTDEGEPAVSKRQAKKVRFSPNNDLLEYEPGKKQMAMVTNTKVQRRSVAKKVDNSVIDDSNTVELTENGAQTSVKLTRLRVQGKHAVNDAEKGTDVVKGTEGNFIKVTRSKAHTLAKGGVDENKPRKRAVKGVENASESVDETVIDRVRVTRSKAETKRSGKQVAKDVRTVEQSEGTNVVKGTEDNLGKITRSKANTLGKGGVDENKPRKSAVKDVENASESADETVIDRVRVTRSKAETKRSGKQVAKDVRTVEQSDGTDVVKGTEDNLGKVNRSKAHTLAKGGVNESKPRKRAVKNVENASESVDETVIDRVRVTRSKAETKRSGKQVAKDVRSIEQSEKIMDIPVRVTRSRGQMSNEDIRNTVNDPSHGKKRTRRELRLTDTSKNSSNVDPEDNQILPKRKSMRTRGVKNMDEDEIDKVKVVNETRVTRLKSPSAMKSSGRNNESKIENKVEEPLKDAGKKNVTRRKSVVQVEKTESVLHLEESVKRRTRKSVVKEQSKEQSDEVKENVTRSREQASENERKAVSSAPGTLKSRKRRSNVVIEDQTVEDKFVSPVDESSNCSVHSVGKIQGKRVAGKQLESSLKTPASRKNAVTQNNGSTKRSKLSGTKQSDSMDHTVKSNEDGSPVSETGNFELDVKVIEPEVTPAIDESCRRFTRSAIRSEGKEPSELAIEEQSQLSSHGVAKFRADPVFSTAPGRITRSGIKVGRKSASNFAERTDKNKRASRSAHQRERFNDDAQISSPEVAEIRPSPDVTMAPSETRLNPNVTTEPQSGIMPIEVQSEIRLNLDVTVEFQSENRPNPDLAVESQFDIKPHPDLVIESQFEYRPNADVTVESESEFRPNLDATVESQSEIKPNLDITVESESEIRQSPDVTLSQSEFRQESQSEIWPSPDVPVESQPEIRPSLEATMESQSEIRRNPDVTIESQSEVGPNPDNTIESLSELGLNPDDTVESQSEVGPNPDDKIESQSELRPNPDVTVESQSELRPNPDVVVSEVRPHPDEPVESQYDIMHNPDINAESQSESRPHPDVAVDSQSEIRFNPDVTTESKSEIKSNPDVPREIQSEFFEERTVQIFEKPADLSALESVRLSTEDIEENRDSHEISNGSNARAKDFGEASSGESILNVKSTPFLTEFAETVPDAISDGSIMQDRNVDVKSSLFGEAEVQVPVNIQKSFLISGKQEADENVSVASSFGNEENKRDSVPYDAGSSAAFHLSFEQSDVKSKTKEGEAPSGESILNVKSTPFLMTEFAETLPDAISDGFIMQDRNVDVKSSLFGEAEVQLPVNIQKSFLISGKQEADENVSVAHSFGNEENKCDSVSYDVGSSAAFHLSFEQSDMKSKTKEGEVPDENDIKDDIHEIPGLGKSDAEDDIVDFGKENVKEHEFEVLQSTGDDVTKIPVSAKSDDEDDKFETEVSTSGIILEEPVLRGGVDAHEMDSVVGEYDAEPKNYDSPNQSAGGDKFFQGLAIDECDTKYDQESNLKPVAGDNVEEADVVPDQHENMPVTEILVNSDLSTSKEARRNPVTSGNDGAEITCDAQEEFILDINKDAVISDGLENATKFTDTQNYSGHQEKVTGLQSKESESVSLDVHHACSYKEEQKVAPVDRDWDSGKFIEDDSNLGVDHEKPTRKESFDDFVANEVITFTEENRNTSTYVDWEDYSFRVDEYQKHVSANASDDSLAESEKDDRVSDIQSVKNVDEDSRNVADEKSNQDEDLLKGNANADMSEEIFNWSDLSLKSLFTPAAGRTRHLKHGQDDTVNFASQDHFAASSLKTLFATPATTQISHLKDVEKDAVSFSFSEYGCNEDVGRKRTKTQEFNNNQLEMESSKDHNRENEMYSDTNFEDYSRKFFEDEEAGGSSEMSAKNKPFELEDNNQADEFKQYDLSSEAAGTNHDLKDNTTPNGDFDQGM